ncbi:MAG: acetyl-CoA carboxylase biotin carboxyl carrier protein subunit, partial [Dysgonamonadaceae bacterium]|nr:acetyl-CoA carboxylase biotin carboxyl carrier protein subunit [Dysgonamonadaceae bacterium]
MKEFSYKINGNPYKVVVNNTTDDTVELEVNGTAYTVEVEAKTSSKPAVTVKRPAAPIAAAPVVQKAAPAAPAAAGANTVQSPLPGV